MQKLKATASMVLAAVLLSSLACGQEIKTVTGHITQTDAEGGIISVDTGNGIQVFYIMTESELYMSAHHMSSIEIQKEDPVTITYFTSANKNKIVKLVDTKS